MVIKLKLLLHQTAKSISDKLFHVAKGKKLKVGFFQESGTSKANPLIEPKKPLSSTLGNIKKLKIKRNKALDPDDVSQSKLRRVDREASDAMKMAADKIMEAATLIVNCMTELRPELKALSIRNYREIQLSTNAVKQLVRIL